MKLLKCLSILMPLMSPTLAMEEESSKAPVCSSSILESLYSNSKDDDCNIYTQHCPKGASLRKMVFNHEERIIKREGFDFYDVDSNKKWRVSGIQFYNYSYPAQLAFNDIANLPIAYNATKDRNNWGMAQFHNGGANYLVFHLNLIEEK